MKTFASFSLLASLSASVLLLAACGGNDGYVDPPPPPPPPPPPAASLSRGATSSGPIQISADDKTVWVANPETHTVAAFNVAGDAKLKLGDISVGKEPRNLAIAPDGKRVFVANAGENTLTVIDAPSYKPIATVSVGAQPYGLAFTPNGRKLYVANAGANTVSVVDPVSYKVLKTIDGVGQEPRGVAVTNDGDDRDDDEKLYVTQFFGVDREGVRNGTILIGADDYKEGRVAVISTASDQLVKQAVLEPMADTGFKSNGSALKKIAPKFVNNDPKQPIFDVVTGAFPNMLQSIVIKGQRAYLPNTCPSPDGPVRFNVNMQSCLSVLDTSTDAEGKVAGVSQTLNMNRGINFEVADETNEFKRLFLAVPWAVAFKNKSNEGYAVSLSSNVIVKVRLDADGTPTINAPKAAGDPGAIVRILVGQGPRGIVINGSDTRAYVANENSRDVSVIDLTQDKELHRFASAPLPPAGSSQARALIGKAVFDSSTGVDLPQLSSPALSGVVRRFPATLSNEGWGSCFACHGLGRTDNVVWIFGTGPRRSSPLHWTYNPAQAAQLLAGGLKLDDADIKLLNHSAINNDTQDFQNNMLDVSGGSEAKSQDAGLILGGDGKTAGGPNAAGLFDGSGAGGSKPPLNVDNRNRSAQLDAMAFYMATGIAQPISPLSFEPLKSQYALQVERGRKLFGDANCASCHGGAGWASGRLLRLGTPQGTIVLDAGVPVTKDVLRDVGTFNAAAANEVKQNGTTAAGALGFNPPSLLGAFNLGPFLHNGSAFTLEDVMALKTHRTAGLAAGAPDPFDDAQKRADLVAFLNAVDATTAPFDIPAATADPAAAFALGVAP